MRAATSADAEAIFTILRTASLAAFAHVFPPAEHPYPDDAIRAEWHHRLTDGATETLIAELDGRADGYVAYASELLVSLFVLPEAQGQGVGSALHDAALAAQPGLGARICRLWVLGRNDAARAFYEHRGWHLDGRRRTANYPPYPELVGYTIEL
ncbi:MAG TPA: GNAT family N-acetyltransferase [Solirubrobacteraceae bacterium]